jgi:hypothetical protein
MEDSLERRAALAKIQSMKVTAAEEVTYGCTTTCPIKVHKQEREFREPNILR